MYQLLIVFDCFAKQLHNFYLVLFGGFVVGYCVPRQIDILQFATLCNLHQEFLHLLWHKFVLRNIQIYQFLLFR